ncbi:fungal-specific transcription factor domain-containing protein [Amylocystis lapponica]|nr:fungal-specific transcription factor domain-containing protein [Amylocystis lapponica]
MPDVPQSPRKSVSSVSAAARSQKKTGAPKPKGAVRAKSGCYTCRIRRKKCDEQPNAEGACQTCVRLRLQCLGFGAKRPDWMRENNSVTELREKIKSFLASQGMIKGHSGSGPRTSEQDPQMLVLVDNIRASPSSPPTPTLSASSSDGHRPHGGLNTSFVRDGSHYPPMQPEPQYSASRLPASGGSATTFSTTPAASYSQWVPGMPSTFNSSYNVNYSYEDEQEEVVQVGGISTAMLPFDIPMVPNDQTNLVQHYLSNVLPIQYLLADRSISDFMMRLIQASPAARDAACLLSALHLDSMRFSSRPHSTDMGAVYRRMNSALSSKNTYNEGDAMAGLHIVSTFLFSGGRGQWQQYLDIASEYVHTMFNNTQYYGPEDVLKNCPESTRFIIKTTMWFDVLASVTTQKIPRFLTIYRQLFGQASAYIGDVVSSPPEISMLPVMGCENHIVLAIAEISNLAFWKETQRRRGSLSVPQLVERGIEIENRYLQVGGPSTYGQRLDGLASDPDVAQRRRLTNDIFRASARVYLHTVLSGDYPSCPEIVAAVADTIECLRRVPTDMPIVSRSVVRSVVFGICICGCLTDDPRHRTFLHSLLSTQQDESVGNVSEVRGLMEAVWRRREHNQGRPVNWREVMLESHRELLLLV